MGGVGGEMGQTRKQRIDLADLRPGGSGNGGIAPVGGINPYTNRPYSSKYHDILAKRRGLPVYEFLDDLLAKVKKNQVSGCGMNAGIIPCKCVEKEATSLYILCPFMFTVSETAWSHVLGR